jgi:hypothetical protein
MTRVRLVLAGLPLLAGGLAGCAGDAQDPVRDMVVDVTAAANERDAGALRDAVDDLLAELDAQVDRGELTSAEAGRLGDLARQVQADADLIDQELIDAQAEEAARRAEEQAAEEAEREAEERDTQEAEDAAREAEQIAREAEKKAEEAAREAEEKADENSKGKGNSDKDDDEDDD